MKYKLVILSDLWGAEKSEWTKHYINALEKHYNVVYYDCCKLGGIDTTAGTEANLHEQFVNGGINTAVAQLLEKEKEAIDVLAFSVGGSIAWKATLQGLKVRKLYAVSATRLRYEEQRPDCSLHLFYGQKDIYRPKQAWLNFMKPDYNKMFTLGHELYKDNSCAEEIIKYMLTI